MDDNCGEWVDCIGVAGGCDEQEACVASGSGWNLRVWLVGLVVRRYIDFLILLIPIYSSCISSFFKQHPYFHFKNVFRSCSSTFCNKILCIKFFFAKYKHTYGQLPWQPYEGYT